MILNTNSAQVSGEIEEELHKRNRHFRREQILAVAKEIELQFTQGQSKTFTSADDLMADLLSED